MFAVEGLSTAMIVYLISLLFSFFNSPFLPVHFLNPFSYNILL